MSAGVEDLRIMKQRARENHINLTTVRQPAFIERLRAGVEASRQKPPDPWLRRLANLNGRKGRDNVESLSTEAVFDFLDVRPHERTPDAGRRLKAIMCQLGWTWTRARHVTATGSVGRVRGYARYLSS
jgi:hypothetical protein